MEKNCKNLLNYLIYIQNLPDNNDLNVIFAHTVVTVLILHFLHAKMW